MYKTGHKSSVLVLAACSASVFFNAFGHQFKLLNFIGRRVYKFAVMGLQELLLPLAINPHIGS